MPIPVLCVCGKTSFVPDSAAGKRVRCNGCGAVLSVPAMPPLPATTRVPTERLEAIEATPVAATAPVVQVTTAEPLRSNPLATASLVLGILSALVCWIPCIGYFAVPCGLIGVALGIAGLAIATGPNRAGGAAACAGLVLSLGGAAFPFALLAFALWATSKTAVAPPPVAPPPPLSVQPAPRMPLDPAPKLTKGAEPKKQSRIVAAPKEAKAFPDPESEQVQQPAIPAKPLAPPPSTVLVGDAVIFVRPGDLPHTYVAVDLASFATLNEYLAHGIEGPFRRLLQRKSILRVPNGTEATVEKVRPNGLYVHFRIGKKRITGWVPTDHVSVRGR